MESNKKNILIYPAGSESAINIYNSLKYNIHFNVFGASMKDNHSAFIYDKEHYCEGKFAINNESFFEEFNNMLSKFHIDFIICTHDEVITFLMQNQDKIKATICCSPVETVEIAYDKKKTYETFEEYAFNPKIYTKIEDVEYPVFLKPRHGAGGKGTSIANNEQELRRKIEEQNNLVMCEYLPGAEYTIDCFTNKDGVLKFSYARTRERITNGISYRSRKVENNKEFEKIANEINNKLKFRGAWFFQVKETYEALAL